MNYTNLLLIIAITLTSKAYALNVTESPTGTIKCHTPNHSKEFIIEKNSITFQIPRSLNTKVKNRSLASSGIIISSIRKKLRGNGITRYLNFEGQKHTFHIENKDHFSEVDDYLSIRSQKGHEIIYPLTCSKV